MFSDIISGVFSSVSSNPVDWISTGLNAYDYFTERNDRENAEDRANQVSDLQIQQALRQMGIYDEGSEALRSALTSMIEGYGDFGAITPDNFDDFATYAATNRQNEDAANMSEIERIIKEVSDGTRNIEYLDKDELSALEAEGRLRAREYYDRGYAMTEEDVRNIYGGDIAAQEAAPSWRDYAMEQDLLSMKFAQMFSRETDREIANATARMSASLPAGMEHSTLRVEAEKALASAASDARNRDLLRSIEAAQGYMQGLQGTASNEQGMSMQEREMSRALFGDNLAARELNFGLQGNALRNELLGGEYGIGLANTGRSIRNNALNFTTGVRGSGISELGAIQNLQDDQFLQDWDAGVGMITGANDLRGRGINEAITVTTTPYTFGANGATQSINTLNVAGANANNARNYYSQAANTAGRGLGTSLQELFRF